MRSPTTSWLPLASQQLRLRNLERLTVHNIQCQEQSLIYFTLHGSPYSAPSYTSSLVRADLEPILQWPEIRDTTLGRCSSTTIIVRVWQQKNHQIETNNNNSNNVEEKVIFSCGVNLSGLVAVPTESSYTLGPNSLVFHMKGGFSFISSDSITVVSAEEETNTDLVHYVIGKRPENSNFQEMSDSDQTPPKQIELRVRYLNLSRRAQEVAKAYPIDQLLTIQQKQMRLKYKKEALTRLIDEINMKSAFCMNLDLIATRAASSSSSQYYRRPTNVHSSMGRTLTRLLNMEPEQIDPTVMLKAQNLRTSIEAVRFRCGILALERERARAYIEMLETRLSRLCDRNVETESCIMARYHAMSKEKEASLHLKLNHTKQLEIFASVRKNLARRRQHLLRELNDIIEVREHEGGYFTINGISLPDAESFKSHIPPLSVSVALGYCAHVVLTCSLILNMSLRNPIRFEGSQSKIVDSAKIVAHDQIFPLFCRIMPPPEVTLYALFLLNQNIAQLQYQLGLPRQDQRMTLSNLMQLTAKCQLEMVQEGGGRRPTDLRSISNYGSSVDVASLPPICSPLTPREEIIHIHRSIEEAPKKRISRSMEFNDVPIGKMAASFSSEPTILMDKKQGV